VVYRASAKKDEEREYAYVSARARNDAGFRILMLALFPVLGAALGIGAVVSPGVGFVSFFLVFFVVWNVANRFGDAGGLKLRVHGSMFEVTRFHSRKAIVRVPLADLHGVSVRTFEKRATAVDLAPVANFGRAASGSGLVDEANIVLTFGTREPFTLTSWDTSPTESAEHVSEIRAFLRGCGWRPASERGVADDAAGDESP